jgi:hypothetical protein
MPDYNEQKYWIESSDLTEAEKIQMAKDLRELESRGVIEFRSGCWRLLGPRGRRRNRRDARRPSGSLQQ